MNTSKHPLFLQAHVFAGYCLNKQTAVAKVRRQLALMNVPMPLYFTNINKELNNDNTTELWLQRLRWCRRSFYHCTGGRSAGVAHYRYCAEYNYNLYSYLRYPSCHGVFFKQKTAYEIHERLVGSEMCIRDRNQRTRFLFKSVSYTHLTLPTTPYV